MKKYFTKKGGENMYMLVQLARKQVLLMLVVAFVFGLALTPIATQAAGDEQVPPVDVANDTFGLGTLNQSPEAGGLALGKQSLQSTVAQLINVALGLLGIVVVVLLVINGAKWMLANGNEDQIAEAKKGITAAIIGLALILSAFAITRFVFNAFFTATDVQGGLPDGF